MSQRYVRNAEEITIEDKLNDAMNALKDDFNFVMDGIDKIAADGDIQKAMELTGSLSEMINASIEEMAESIASDEE